MSKAAGMSGLSSEETQDCRFFMETIDGLSAREAAKALMDIAPCIDLNKVSKGAMARRWACRNSPIGDLVPGLTQADLVRSVARIKDKVLEK